MSKFNGPVESEAYEIDEPSDEERASSSSEDELDVLLNGTPDQKKKLIREYLTGESESSSGDEFEKEMEAELSSTLRTMEGSWAPAAAETGGGSEVVGSSNPQMYDSVYFDSDSEEEDTADEPSRRIFAPVWFLTFDLPLGISRQLFGSQAEAAPHSQQRRAAVRPGGGRPGPGLGGRQEARRQDTRGRGTPLRCSGLTEKRRRTQLSRLHDHAVPGLSATRDVPHAVPSHVRDELCGEDGRGAALQKPIGASACPSLEQPMLNSRHFLFLMVGKTR